jgi:hypothetical protein
MSFETRHAHQRRRVDTPAAAKIISIKVAGSGTATFVLARAPLPVGWEKRLIPN